MLILVVVGVGLVIYAVYEMFFPAKTQTAKKKKSEISILPVEDSGKEQKIQRLQNEVAQLKEELNKINAECAQEKSALIVSKENEAKLSEELKRRNEWVAKAEAELAKIKSEDSDLSKKFTTKEKELQDEFSKNVNSERLMRDIKASLEIKEAECKNKEDQIQAQNHQIQEQLNMIKEQLAVITEFKQKEKISEWVPKEEFNKLNEEYSALEKDLEENQAKLKSFAEEIVHLRKEVKHIEEPKQAEEVQKATEPKSIEETNLIEEVRQEAPRPVEENIEKADDENKQKEEEV